MKVVFTGKFAQFLYEVLHFNFLHFFPCDCHENNPPGHPATIYSYLFSFLLVLLQFAATHALISNLGG